MDFCGTVKHGLKKVYAQIIVHSRRYCIFYVAENMENLGNSKRVRELRKSLGKV